MAVNLSPDVQQEIERVRAAAEYVSADEVVRSALIALEAGRAEFWERVERLDAEAEADVAAGRYRPVDDEFIALLKSMVTRPGH